MKKLSTFALIPLCFGVVACSAETMIQSAFPDNRLYEVTSGDGEDSYRFSCAPRASEAATKAQLAKAQRMTDAYLEAAAEAYVEMFLAEEDISFRDAMRINKEADAQAEVFVEAMLEETGCLLVDSE